MKKTYLAPQADMILLAAADGLALSEDQQQAAQWWGVASSKSVTASPTSGATTNSIISWNDDGSVTAKK